MTKRQVIFKEEWLTQRDKQLKKNCIIFIVENFAAYKDNVKLNHIKVFYCFQTRPQFFNLASKASSNFNVVRNLSENNIKQTFKEVRFSKENSEELGHGNNSLS